MTRLLDTTADPLPQPVRHYVDRLDGEVRGDELAAFTPIPTPSAALNRALGGGWLSDNVYILAGAPGIGKTSFALQALAHAVRHGAAGLGEFFEHSGELLTLRLVCQASYESAPDATLSLTEIHRLVREARGRGDQGLDAILRADPRTSEAVSTLTRYWTHLYLKHASTRRTTLRQIQKDAEDVLARTQRRVLVVVDAIQLIAPDRTMEDRNRAERMMLAMAWLKALASPDGLHCPVLVVSMARSEAIRRIARDGGFLELADLEDGGGGAFPYMADFVLIANPASPRVRRQPGAPLEVVWDIQKARSAETGSIRMVMDGRSFHSRDADAPVPLDRVRA